MTSTGPDVKPQPTLGPVRKERQQTTLAAVIIQINLCMTYFVKTYANGIEVR